MNLQIYYVLPTLQ